MDTKAIWARANAATAGEWRSMREGNQFIKTKYMPAAECVGASRVDGIVRPWNPHALLAFGFPPDEYEKARFLDADADFIAAARTDVPALCNRVEELESALREIAIGKTSADNDHPLGEWFSMAGRFINVARTALEDK